MPILEEKQIAQELDKKSLRQIYLLAGEETGKLEYFLQKIEKVTLPDGRNSFNYEGLYSDEIKANPFLERLFNFSLWQGKKLVVLKRVEKWPAKEQEVFLEALETELENSVLVLCADKLDGRSKLSNFFTKTKNPGIALVRCEALKDTEWSFWLKSMADRYSLKISPEAREWLLRVGFASVLDLDQALSKAALFVREGESLEVDHLREVQVWGQPESVFGFTDAILAKLPKQSLELLIQLERQSEEPLQLLALIARQFRLLQQIGAYRASGKSESTISTELRLFPRQARGLFQGVARRSAKEIFEGLNRIAEADQAIKSTREPQFQILQRLSLELTTRQ